MPSTPSLFSHQRLNDETDLTDPGQLAYKAGNPWLWPKLVGVAAAFGRRRLYRADIHLESPQDQSVAETDWL